MMMKLMKKLMELTKVMKNLMKLRKKEERKKKAMLMYKTSTVSYSDPTNQTRGHVTEP